MGTVDDNVRNLIYILADMRNKIWFVAAIWHAAKQETAAKAPAAVLAKTKEKKRAADEVQNCIAWHDYLWEMNKGTSDQVVTDISHLVERSLSSNVLRQNLLSVLPRWKW